MSELAKIATELGPYALFSLAVLWIVFKWLKDRKTTLQLCKGTVFDAPTLIKKVDEIHGVVIKEDSEGVKLVFARHKSLEQAIIMLSKNTEAQTNLLIKIHDDTRDTKKEIERLNN